MGGRCVVSGFARKFANDERGATSIEYALIASLICLVIISGITAVGTEVSAVFDSVATAYQDAR